MPLKALQESKIKSRAYLYMIELLPECSKRSSPVTDSLETEIEQHGKVKTGHYTDRIWMCHDCIEIEEEKKKSKGADNSSPSIDQCDTIELQVDLIYSIILPRRMKPAYDSSMSFYLDEKIFSKFILIIITNYKLQQKPLLTNLKFSWQNYK